jgi:uncharacterized membrane protein YphA (DoxX/SURF4 family)
MAANREATGLALLRILLGVFFLFEAINKLPWLLDQGPLVGRLQEWLTTAWPANRWYLETVALPGATIFARVVMLGELAAGLALILGVWTRLAAALAFLMVLNFHFASGAIFQYRFLTNGYGLPVLGGLLALALGGARLPFSLRK